jgi:hypothetical protein
LSIIYDALKKSQKARATQSPQPRRQLRMPNIPNMPRMPRIPRIPRISVMKVNRKNMILMLLILTSLFIMAMMLTVQDPPGASHLFAQEQFVKKPLLAKASTTSSPRLMLEGVFLSDNEQLAMINHHSYHVGDKVNGMQVVNIALDEVTLQDKKHSVVLRNTITALD